MAQWRKTINENAAFFEFIIKEVEKNGESNEAPAYLADLVNLAKHILRILLEARPLEKNYHGDFKRFARQASGLVVVLRFLYLQEKPHLRSGWPPPHLGRATRKLSKTVYRVDKLLKRKRDNNILKRQIFVLLDWGKIQKCSRKLDSVVENIEEKYWQKNTFNVNKTLLKAVKECKESQGNPKPVAEGSQQQDAEKSLTELMKSRDGQVEDKTLTSKDKGQTSKQGIKQITTPRRNPEAASSDSEESIEHEGNQSSSLRENSYGLRRTSASPEPIEEDDQLEHARLESEDKKRRLGKGQGQITTQHKEEDVENEEKRDRFSSIPRDSPRSRQRLRCVEDEEDREESSSQQAGNTAQNNRRTKDNERYGNTNVRPGRPGSSTGPPKKRSTRTRPTRETSSQSSPQQPSARMSFETGRGTTLNRNVGNIYNTKMENIGNNYSVNHYATGSGH